MDKNLGRLYQALCRRNKSRPLWNLLRIINPEAEFKVVIEAHADEISWYVNYISDDGMIYVIRNGGSETK